MKFESDIKALFFRNFFGYLVPSSSLNKAFLDYMRKDSKIQSFKGQIALTCFNLDDLQLFNEQNYNNLLQEAKQISKFLTNCPGIVAFSICNSIALKTCNKDSDIDFFIICDPQLLFVARLGVMLYLKSKALLPKVCPSFWISTKALNLSAIRLKNDLYLEHWLNSLAFETSSKAILDDFNKLNSSKATLKSVYSLSKPWYLAVLKLLNPILRYLQLSKAQRTANKLKSLRACSQDSPVVSSTGALGICIEPNMLKFHMNDIRLEFNPLFLREYDAFLQGNRVKTYQQYRQVESK